MESFENINEVRQYIRIRYDHLCRILNSCQNLEQFAFMLDYREQLDKQIDWFIKKNEPYIVDMSLDPYRLRRRYYSEVHHTLNFYKDRYNTLEMKIEQLLHKH